VKSANEIDQLWFCTAQAQLMSIRDAIIDRGARMTHLIYLSRCPFGCFFVRQAAATPAKNPKK
jgi:hypothetical protein